MRVVCEASNALLLWLRQVDMQLARVLDEVNRERLRISNSAGENR